MWGKEKRSLNHTKEKENINDKEEKHQEEREGRILMKTEHNGVSGHKETVEVCHMLETSIPWKTRRQRVECWRAVGKLARGAEENVCHQKPSRVGN